MNENNYVQIKLLQFDSPLFAKIQLSFSFTPQPMQGLSLNLTNNRAYKFIHEDNKDGVRRNRPPFLLKQSTLSEGRERG